MKMVLDTNLLIAANYNKRSASCRILEKAEKGEVRVFWTREIRKEAEKILNNIKAGREFRLFLDRAVFRKENEVKNPPKVNVVKDDPADNKFLACAQKGKAELVVTNDRHLLNLGNYKGIPVVTPVEAIKAKL